MDALQRWTAQLQALAIPEQILAAAPVSPWGHNVSTFQSRTDRALIGETPTRRRALEALPEGGSVLDVGCGAGAASLPLGGRAGLLVGVDSSARMLQAYAERAAALGVAHEVVEGTWPAAADEVGSADVVVCAHVLYNTPDLAAFVTALNSRARRRVVMEQTESHPLAWLRPYWQRFHGLDRPAGPTVADALAALEQLGIAAEVERFDETAPWHDLVALVRQRLCLPPGRDPEIAAAISELGVPERRPLVTLWWTPS